MDDPKINCPFCESTFEAQEIKVHIAKDHFFGIEPQIEDKPKDDSITAKTIPLKKYLENQENFGDGSFNLSNLSDTKHKKHGVDTISFIC